MAANLFSLSLRTGKVCIKKPLTGSVKKVSDRLMVAAGELKLVLIFT